MPGPAPKPASQRRRTNAVPGTIFLPAEGRQGKPPKWPLPGPAASSWTSLWRLPQAVAWERQHLVLTVARYAGLLAQVQAYDDPRDVPVSLHAEVRQSAGELGLSSISLLRLRWEIAEPTPTSSESSSVRSLADFRRARED